MHLHEGNCQKTYIDNLKKDIKSNCFDSSGKKLNIYITKWKKKWFDTNNLTNLYSKIIKVTQWIPKDNLQEKIYCILNDIETPKLCYCNNKVSFESFSRGYREYCSVKCRANSKKWVNDVKTTCLEKYGVDHVRKVKEYNESVRNKLKENSYIANIDNTTRKKYVEQSKETKKKKYGDLNTGWNQKGIETRLRNKNMVPIELREPYIIYKQRVIKFTKETLKEYAHKIKNIEKRDNHARNPDAYHIDHMVSLYDGFTNGIPPFIIGSLHNLRCIHYKENLKKQKKSCKTVTQLLDEYYDTIEI